MARSWRGRVSPDMDAHLRRPCGHCGQGRDRHIGSALCCWQGYGTSWNPNAPPCPKIAADRAAFQEAHLAALRARGAAAAPDTTEEG